MESCVIRGGQQGYERLKVLARTWAASTAALLDRVGVGEGTRVRDAVARLEEYAADPTTMVGSPRMFQVWGRRSLPGAGSDEQGPAFRRCWSRATPVCSPSTASTGGNSRWRKNLIDVDETGRAFLAPLTPTEVDQLRRMLRLLVGVGR